MTLAEHRDTTPDLITPAVARERFSSTRTYGRFRIEPLPPGYAQTVGNSIRRALYGGLLGAAITSAQIDNALHEYDSIPGVVEQVGDIVLNLKGVNLKLLDRGLAAIDPGHLQLDAIGPGLVVAGDLIPPAGIEIANPGHRIALIDSSGARLSGRFSVAVGRGYRAVDPVAYAPRGHIPLDAIFSPILKAHFAVAVAPDHISETATVEIWTTGAISPTDALREAAATLIRQFAPIYELAEPQMENIPPPPTPRPVPVVVLELDNRAYNALERAGVETVAELLDLGPARVKKLKGVGKLTYNNIVERLDATGYLPSSPSW